MQAGSNVDDDKMYVSNRGEKSCNLNVKSREARLRRMQLQDKAPRMLRVILASVRGGILINCFARLD
jgi:hypothetical protein